MSEHEISARVVSLERALRRAQRIQAGMLVFGAAALVAACASLGAATPRAVSQGQDGILRARGIVITDEKGTERIHIGAPVPDPPGAGERVMDATGMLIHDANGKERFGLGVMPNGVVAMGFDAPPGVGDKRSSERLHMGVLPDGRSFIRFLDQKTMLAGMLHLDETDDLVLDIWNGKEGGSFARGRLDINGWHKLPDHKESD
jgi:hypothetical protein